MPITVMPKGVEHTNSLLDLRDCNGVPITVMPKGVEHETLVQDTLIPMVVPITVMPKGVEHDDGTGGTTYIDGCQSQ